jgi:PAS domain S-box-containing protein
MEKVMNDPFEKTNPNRVEHFKDIVATIREPLLVLDVDLRILAANRSFYKFFKVKAGETIGQLIYDLGNRQWDIPGLRLLLETILPQKATFNEYSVEHDFPVIGRRILLLNARRIPRPPNEAQWILLAFEDATKRMRLEADLQASEQRFRRAFETAQDGMLLFEKSAGQVVNSNQSAEQLLGRSKRSLLKKNLWQLGILKDEEQFKQIALQLEEKGVIGLPNLTIPCKRGGHFPADVFLIDKAAVIQCNIREISERKQAEKSVRNLARFPIENPNPVMRIDRGGNLVYANQSALVQLADWKLELGGAVPGQLNEAVKHVFKTGAEKTVESICGERFFSLVIEPTPGARDVSVYGRDITTRRQAEEKVQYQAFLLEHVDDAVIGSDSELRLISWNKAAERIYGWKEVEVLGRNALEIIRTEWADADAKGIIKLVNAQGHWQGEATHACKDGSRIPVEISTSLLRDAAGQITGYVSIARDISERKQAENQIIQMKRLYATLSQVNQAIVRVKDRADLYQSICDVAVTFGEFIVAWVGLLDEASGEVRPVSANGVDVVHWPFQLVNIQQGASKDGLVATAIRISKVTTSEDIEVDKRTISSFEQFSKYNYHSSAAIPFRLKGKTIGMLNLVSNKAGLFKAPEEVNLLEEMGLDISFALDTMAIEAERKQAEEALKSRTDFLDKLIDSSALSTWISDEQGTAIRTNPACLKFFGAMEQEVIGKYNLFRDAVIEKQGFMPEIKRVFEKGEAASVMLDYDFGAVEAVTVKNATHKFINSIFTPILDGNGKVSNVIVQSIDLTEIKKAEEEIQQLNVTLEKRIEERTVELRQAQEQLVRKEKLAVLGQLAGGVGHELRNPLGVISNSVYYLKLVQPDANEKITKHYGMIEQEVHIATKIVSDLLDYARVISADAKPASVSELVEHALSRFPVPASIPVSLKIPADLLEVYADPLHVEQILGNLITNACQAMGEGGKLTISAHLKKKLLVIAVKDIGPGITPENMQKLFEPLFSTKVTGIGLGLAVSKKLAEVNGGRIEVQSEVGQGSTFTLYLPVYDPRKDIR